MQSLQVYFAALKGPGESKHASVSVWFHLRRGQRQQAGAEAEGLADDGHAVEAAPNVAVEVSSCVTDGARVTRQVWTEVVQGRETRHTLN